MIINKANVYLKTDNIERIYILLIATWVVSNLVCLLVLHRSLEVQQLMAKTRLLQQTADRLDGTFGVKLLSLFLNVHCMPCRAPSIRQLFIGGNNRLARFKQCVDNHVREMFYLVAVAGLLMAGLLVAGILVAFFAVCVVARCRAIPVTQRMNETQMADCDRLKPYRCTWCPDTHCCPCCPEYPRLNPSCRSCPRSTCCRCCPAPGCSCCTNPDCCNSLGCICPESHCCVTWGCLHHTRTNPSTAQNCPSRVASASNY
ncbi:hypothetical protein E2C01_058387 [Portunus trituberculatus]|uniref:Uncharacterized protein n=1 Tax=Portunus trituberculatus TaxID=210409 RepID=A0A5B7H3L3_PORTR|nr:hypothetical protein [Portunus trituberculatus]